MIKKLILSMGLVGLLALPASAFTMMSRVQLEQPAYKPTTVKEAVKLNNAIFSVAKYRAQSGHYTGPRLSADVTPEMKTVMRETAKVYAVLLHNGLLDGMSLGRAVDISLYIAGYTNVAVKHSAAN